MVENVSQDNDEPVSEGDHDRPTVINNKDVIIPNCFCCCRKCCCCCKLSSPDQPLLRINHNVLLTLILDVLYGISDSLWSGTVFVAYLKRWSGGQNYLVGNVEAVNGLAVLVSALPVGYLADKYGRSRVIKAGGILIACTAVAHLMLIRYIGPSTESTESKTQSHVTVVLLSIIMAMWGIGGGIATGPCDALYADSTPAGERSQYYFYMFVCYMLASCCGPLLAIIMFQTMGDNWDLYHLQVVLYVGLSLEFFNALLMLLFDDAKALDENTSDDGDEDTAATMTARTIREQTSSEATADTEPESNTPSTLDLNGDGDAMDELRRPLLTGDVDHEDANNNIASEISEEDLLRKRQRRIPYILFFSSFVMAMGSGMTIKFFPLFFKDQVGFSPTQVQGIYVLAPLTMALFSSVATSMARWFGRVQTVMLMSTGGVACLLAMVFGFDHYFHQHKYQLVVMYLLRTALMNCTYPLFGSILMDFVPKQERARWKSLESISQFGWCGSAALGGYISDRFSYNHTFGVTALLQGIGIILFAFLLPLVPRREQDLASEASSNVREGRNIETTENGDDHQDGPCCAAFMKQHASENGCEVISSNRLHDGEATRSNGIS